MSSFSDKAESVMRSALAKAPRFAALVLVAAAAAPASSFAQDWQYAGRDIGREIGRATAGESNTPRGVIAATLGTVLGNTVGQGMDENARENRIRREQEKQDNANAEAARKAAKFAVIYDMELRKMAKETGIPYEDLARSAAKTATPMYGARQSRNVFDMVNQGYTSGGQMTRSRYAMD